VVVVVGWLELELKRAKVYIILSNNKSACFLAGFLAYCQYHKKKILTISFGFFLFLFGGFSVICEGENK